MVDLTEFTSQRGFVHQMFRQLTAAFFSGVLGYRYMQVKCVRLTTGDELDDENKKIIFRTGYAFTCICACTMLQELRSGSPQQVIYDTSVDLPPLVPETSDVPTDRASSLDTGVRSRWYAVIIMHN